MVYVKRLEDCNNVNIEGVIPILAVDNINKGSKYGYYTDNLHRRCNNIILNKEKSLIYQMIYQTY